MPNSEPFALRSSFDLSLEHVGGEREPVLSIERTMASPEELVDYAAEQVSFSPAWGPQGGYPGLRAPAPLDYVENLVRTVDPFIRRAFSLGPVKLARAQCNFSIVTLPSDQLKPLQTIPHVDTVDPLQFAVLHYLCGPDKGGTAFYRHRATGFETLSADRQQPYDKIRDAELELLDDEPGYITGDTAHFVQTARFEAAFDKVLIYRSRVLHSGLIPAQAKLSSDARGGRLTANIFVNYRG